MQNLFQIETITPKQTVKLILLAPIMGGILSSLYFTLYLIYTLLNLKIYSSLGLGGFLIEFFKIFPLLLLGCFALSYVLGIFLLVPSSFIQKRYELNDSSFWFLNALAATVIGVSIGYSYSNVNSVLVFVIFISIFSCGLFNASLLTESRKIIIKKNKNLEIANKKSNDSDKDNFISQ